jgi:hypothetical protein
LARIREWARAIGKVEGERLRRIDLAADFERWPIRSQDAEHFVPRPNAKISAFDVHTYETPAADPTDSRCTGHVVCEGNPFMARIYDKHAELFRNAGTEREQVERSWRAIEEQRWWHLHGWQGGRVTRVEFQIRSPAVKEFSNFLALRGEEKPEDLDRNPDLILAHLDEIWNYAVNAWLRMAIPESATRRARWKTDPRWCAVQAIVWEHQTTERAKRKRIRGKVTWQQTLGCIFWSLREADDVPRQAEIDTTSAETVLDAILARWKALCLDGIAYTRGPNANAKQILLHGLATVAASNALAEHTP